MIVLFTDFGEVGPYAGQVKAVLARNAPGVSVVDLLHDAPAFQAKPSSYLLAALIDVFPTETVFLCVVDPGVGGDRAAIVVEADGRWFVGPDNGLFEVVMRRANSISAWNITWRPESLSASFHGRDLFASVAAMLARDLPSPGGAAPPGDPIPESSLRQTDWPDDLAEIIYIDNFGNAMTGLRARGLGTKTRLEAGGHTTERFRTFSDLPSGGSFWYENSSGLAEIAVNKDRADRILGLGIGDPVIVHNTGPDS
ncbi:MAG: SAM-dependent chlorinase/fluorinase [Rhodospirillales bacterium]|nr:SAM-dependent chlorinase/fluorinase [Rhodospirillales bacterium]